MAPPILSPASDQFSPPPLSLISSSSQPSNSVSFLTEQNAILWKVITKYGLLNEAIESGAHWIEPQAIEESESAIETPVTAPLPPPSPLLLLGNNAIGKSSESAPSVTSWIRRSQSFSSRASPVTPVASAANSLLASAISQDPFSASGEVNSSITEEDLDGANSNLFVITFLRCDWDFDEKGKDLSRYLFSVKPPGLGEGWIIEKKIKDFTELEGALKKDLSKVSFDRYGKIGERSVLTGNSPASRSLKKSALRFYLTQLLQNIPNAKSVRSFINSDKISEAEVLKRNSLSSNGELNSLLGGNNFLKEGYMLKKGSFFTPWIVRYYRLKNARLDYYQSKYGPVHGSIKLPNVVIESHPSDDEFKHAFVLSNRQEQFYLILCTENDTERDEWVYHIRSVIQESQKQLGSSLLSAGTATTPGAGLSPMQQYSRGSNNSGDGRYSLFPPESYIRNDAESIYCPDEQLHSPDFKQFEGASPFSPDFPSINGGACAQMPVFGVPLSEALKNGGDCMGVPKIVKQCIDYLERNQAHLEQGIFRVCGSTLTIRSLREKLDSEPKAFDLFSETLDIHAASGLLKLFFRELPESLVAKKYLDASCCPIETDQVKTNSDEQLEKATAIAAAIPSENRKLLSFLFAYLRRVTDNCFHNKMTVNNICVIFSATLSMPSWLFLVLFGEAERLLNK